MRVGLERGEIERALQYVRYRYILETEIRSCVEAGQLQVKGESVSDNQIYLQTSSKT